MRGHGFEVYIKSEGERLEEYAEQIEDDDEKTISCWIPSETGKVSQLLRIYLVNELELLNVCFLEDV